MKSVNKMMKSLNKMHIVRMVVILAVVGYIVGIVPTFKETIGDLFSNPLIKLVFLVLIVSSGYFDPTIGTLLAVAFIVSYLGTPSRETPLLDTVNTIGSGASDVVSGIGSGASNIVGGIGSGATQLIKGVGDASTELVSGLQSGR